jgi:hypothetical protein
MYTEDNKYMYPYILYKYSIYISYISNFTKIVQQKKELIENLIHKK